MEFHKPKPVHGWREFLTEVGVIVIGVLIALTAEAAVDSLRWAERTRQTKEHLRAELHLIAVDALAQQTFIQCDRAMIHALEVELAQSGPVWRPPYVQTISFGGVSFLTAAGHWQAPDAKSVITAPEARWDTQAWRNAQADGTANHMSQKDNVAFGRMYELVGRTKALSDQMQADMTALNALYLPQQLDPASRAEYLRVIGRVRGALARGSLFYVEILQRADNLNVVRPRLEEGGPEIAIDQAFCRQFHEGKTDIVYEMPSKLLTGVLPLPSE